MILFGVPEAVSRTSTLNMGILGVVAPETSTFLSYSFINLADDGSRLAGESIDSEEAKLCLWRAFNLSSRGAETRGTLVSFLSFLSFSSGIGLKKVDIFFYGTCNLLYV